MNVVLGICGSIAAYKSLELIRLLKKEGSDVKVILTHSALNFVTPLSCQTLSTNDVYVDQFVLTKGIKHISLSQWADILVIGPATANIIGKSASGIGDDLLSTTVLSFPRHILFVPAMDADMWQNQIVQENVSKLKSMGCHFLEPAEGVLASGKIGKGRFPHTSLIIKKIKVVLNGYKSLAGKKFLVSGGRTEEDIDSMRVITNRSSGRMAVELLNAAVCRDGLAKGVIGEHSVSLTEGMDIMKVRTAEEMLQRLKDNITWCDCLIMAAAVGDYKPVSKKAHKIHLKKLRLELKKNRDIVKEVGRNRGRRIVVGFSLEDRNQVKRGVEKIALKGLDLCVLNSFDAVGTEEMSAKILKKDGKIITVGRVSKWQLANRILDQCCREIEKKYKKK